MALACIFNSGSMAAAFTVLLPSAGWASTLASAGDSDSEPLGAWLSSHHALQTALEGSGREDGDLTLLAFLWTNIPLRSNLPDTSHLCPKEEFYFGDIVWDQTTPLFISKELWARSSVALNYSLKQVNTTLMALPHLFRLHGEHSRQTDFTRRSQGADFTG